MLERGAEGLSEKVDTSHTVYTEIRFPLRIEVIQKKGFALEKSYSSDGKMRQKEPIDIILIKDGKRTNIKEYLPEGTTLIESPEIRSSKIRVIKSNIFTKIITIPKDVLIEPDYVEDWYLSKTGTSLSSLRQDPRSGRELEIHSFFALDGALMLIAHEGGHISFDQSLDEEYKVQMRAIKNKVHTPNYDFSQATMEDMKEYSQAVVEAEVGAWIDGLKMYRHIKEQRGIDISDARTPVGIMRQIHGCLDEYENYLNQKVSLARIPPVANQTVQQLEQSSQLFSA